MYKLILTYEKSYFIYFSLKQINCPNITYIYYHACRFPSDIENYKFNADGCTPFEVN